MATTLDVGYGLGNTKTLLDGLDDEALALVDAADALVPVLEERAEEVDRSGHVSADVFKKLVDAGFIRVGVPKRLGGFGQRLQTLIAICAALGRGCGSTAWVTQIVAGSCMMVSLFGGRAQREVWEDNPDVGACASQGKPRTIARVEGGYRISGQWSYLSGVEHAGWALLGMLDTSATPPDMLFGLVPVADGIIEQTWNVAGMRGTASNTLVLDDYFVPDYRICSFSEVMEGNPPSEFRDEPVTRMPFGPAVELGLLGPPIGVVQGALEHVLKLSPKRGITYSTYPSQNVSTAFQVQVAEAAAKLEAARALTLRMSREIDNAALQNQRLEYIDNTRIRATIGCAGVLLREAMQILTQAHGTSTFAQANPLQRMWRDVNVGTSHGMVTAALGYEVFGKALVGSDERIAPLI